MNKMFKRDLDNVVSTLEKLCQGKANHADYVMAYDYFITSWAPRSDSKPKCKRCDVYLEKAGMPRDLPCTDCGRVDNGS